ncbi:hypothetical protein ACWGA9_40835 [Streptomyces sp. NPDC054950]
MTAEWYVLIEEDTLTIEHPDGVDVHLHRWMLVGMHHIGQDRAEAVAAAEDAALHYIPGILAGRARPGDEPARHVFLAQDGAWVVLVRQRHRECHIRVTVARLVHSQEEKEAPRKSLKEKFHSLLEEPPPPVQPWTWTPPDKREQD